MNNRSIPSTHAAKKLPIFLVNTLLLYIPLLALTHGQKKGQRNELILFGLGNQKKLVPPGYTCCAWAGRTFFQLCCRVSFWFWREIGFGLHTCVLRVPYNCGVVSVFLVLAGNSFWYVRTYHTVVGL